MSHNGGNKEHAIITLVHGTWGRGFFPSSTASRRERARWFERGSEFARMLNGELEKEDITSEVTGFSWSGSNSVCQRDLAAASLAEELRRQALTSPHASRVVIAHSHGGNIALRALLYLQDSSEYVRVVTLATPFLEIFPTPPPNVKNIALMCFFLSFASACGPTAGFFYLLYDTSAFKYPLLILMPIMFLSLFLFSRAWTFFFLKFYGINESEYKPQELRQVSSYNQADRCPSEILVLRGVDDEASLALACGAIGSRIARFTGTVMTHVVKICFLVFFSLVVTSVFSIFVIPEISGNTGRFVDQLFNLVAFVIIACLGTYPLGLVMESFFKGFYGKEFFFCAGCCDISAQSVPDASECISVITLPTAVRGSGRFRHCIYDHPYCSAVIAQWLRVQFDSEKDLGNIL